MEKNGSPPPIFDTDDNLSYFLATIQVHPLCEELPDIDKETTTKEPMNGITVISQKTSQKTSQKIMDLIKEKPDISTEEMGIILKITRRAIAYQIEKLKKNGKIRRIGPDKGGHWEIL